MKRFYAKRSLFPMAMLAAVSGQAFAGSVTPDQGVDLGLSVIWSTQIVETEPSTNYSNEFVWASPFCRVDYSNLGEYVPADMNVGQSIAGTNYDAATALWGEGWRLPTKAEVEELLALGVTFKNVNGVKSYYAEGANGVSVDFTDVSFGKMTFWTANAYIDESNPDDFGKAWGCEFTLTGCQLKPMTRTTANYILPVRDKVDKNIKVTSVSLSNASLELEPNDYVVLYPIVMPDDASVRTVDYVSSDPETVSVDSYGRVKALKAGSATVSAVAKDGSGVKGDCEITVKNVRPSVDLGLSVVWSTQLLDSENPTNYSKEYVWGSPFCRVDYSNLGEYAPFDMWIGQSIAGTNYDPATALWGEGWRLPTKAEVEELISLGDRYATIDGVNGYLIKGKNGNEVFYSDLDLSRRLRFWTAEAYLESEGSEDYSQAWMCEYTTSRTGFKAVKRNETYSILPVRDRSGKQVDVTEVKLSSTDLTMEIGDKTVLYPFVMPENATERRVSYESSDPEVVSVDAYGRIEALKAGEAVVTATAIDGSGVTGRCEIKVPSLEDITEVDLGLSVFWAAYNVGAKSKTDVGTYFMFGTPEIVTKWSPTTSPYTSTLNVPVNNVAGTEYDPATVHMGDGWMTPTKDQMQELFDNCDKVDVDGGFEFVSKINGAKIFIPGSGFMDVTALNAKGDAYIQTAETENTDIVRGRYPCGMIKNGFNPEFGNRSVTQGVTVRAVKYNPAGISSVIADGAAEWPMDVYNLQGVKVLHATDSSTLSSIPSGVYILRGASGKVRKIKF